MIYAAKRQADGTLTDLVVREPIGDEIGLDEIEKAAPGARLVQDPTNPRRAIVAAPAPKVPTLAEQLQALVARVAKLEGAKALLVALVLLTSTACTGARYGGSFEEAARWAAPSSETFERKLEPNTQANPTPVTVTVVLSGGGGGDAIGQAVNTILPGWGWLAGGAVSIAGGVFAGKRAGEGKLAGDLVVAQRAVSTLMGGLELAPHAVRTAVRDQARALGLSHVLEKLIAEGKVSRVPPPREPEAPSPSAPSSET